MITKPTVLVLGAGVSMPYGYPSGGGLLKEIFEKTTENQWLDVYRRLGFSSSDTQNFRADLHQSQKLSIDSFLEHRPEFTKIGKAAIALSLLDKERIDAFGDFDIRDKGIYHYLYNKITSSWGDLKNNKITIVTFNYDRSLEHFLFGALLKSYNKSEAEVAEAIQKYIPIIHVHGSLGPLPWQEKGGTEYTRLFGGGISANEIDSKVRAAIDNIIIVSEANPKTNEFQLATKYLKSAYRIYFLGFGYNDSNVERLRIGNLDVGNIDSTIMYMRGSAFMLGAAERQSINDKWRINLPDNQCDALKFLKEYADLS